MFKDVKIISIQVNSRCNLCCKHCVAENLNEINKEADINLMKKRILGLTKFGLKQVVIILKEPLMYKNIFDLISFCKEKGIETEIITNGTLLTYNIVCKLIESGINVVNISLEGVTSKSNDYIRGTGSFSSAMNGLQLLQREIHNKKLFKPIIIKMTLNSQNKNEWKQFAEYFDKLNINEVIINSITVAGRAQKYDFLKLDDNEYKELVDKIYHRYALLNNPSYILFVHSLRPLAYIFFNIKYNMNSMVCFPDCVSNNGGFSMDMNGKLYSCSENKAEFLMSNGQIKSIPNSLIERHDEINNFLEDNELFNQKRDKLNQERRSLSCLKCRWKARCNPCQFLTNNEYNEMERKCLKYKEKILNLIESNISLGKARIILKESAYIHMKNKRLKFINCYRNGKYLVSSEFDFCNWQNNVINIIIQNQSYLIEKKDLNKKDFISFIYDLLTTDCFYMVE